MIRYFMLLMFCAANACAQVFPEPGESVEAYLDRYEQWLETIPEDDRSWTLLVEIQWNRDWWEGMRSLETDPEAPEWSATVEFLRSNPELLKIVRRVAAKGQVGLPRDQMSADDMDPEEVPPSIGILLPHLGILRRCQQVLLADVQLALQEDDVDRAMENLELIVGIQHQTPVVGALIERLVQLAFSASVVGLVRDESIELEQLSDEHLKRLAGLIIRMDTDDELFESVMFERWSSRDVIDWIFVDSEDGRLTLRGAKRFMNMTEMLTTSDGDQFFNDQARGDDALERARSLQIVVESKDRQLDLIEEIFGLVRSDYSTPAHELRSFTSSQRIDSMSSNAPEGFRYAPVLVCIPDLSRAYTRQVSADAEASTALLLVELAAYHKAHGVYPETIEGLGRFIDPYSGELLGYRLVDGEPLIYSVGLDRDDDGGRVLVDRWGDVVVWPSFVPLDDLEAMDQDDRKSIDGDWVLYPIVE